MRRRLLAVCRGHAATAGLFRRKANPPSSTTSSRTAYRSRRRFLFQSKRHLSLIPSLLLIQTEPAALGFGLGACDEFFYKKLIVRSFCCSSLSPHKRCAGLHSDKGALRGRRFSYCPHKGPAKRALWGEDEQRRRARALPLPACERRAATWGGPYRTGETYGLLGPQIELTFATSV